MQIRVPGAGEKKTAFETCGEIELEENMFTVSTKEQEPPLRAEKMVFTSAPSILVRNNDANCLRTFFFFFCVVGVKVRVD